MGAAFFYHLTRNPLEVTLATLVEKSLGAGWRVEVRGRDDAQLKTLDAALWRRAGFLPHGIAGGAHDNAQPVLLTTGMGGNDATCIMCVGGADVTPDQISAADRVCILFDGHDSAGLEHARGQWKSLTDAGTEAQYWSEESGKWQMKAQHPKPEE
ncbi:DNA polymerase III subunit chi [Pacificibacter marinus]|uniref:DNA polymerase III subunit chi n=1 Tax=Pacificibacter marinus TaxID=658057 RepID=A0A1Y5RPN3_9RHOB|nr:DNA polymerase III subunit chi [Pacificibacter marinus]SEL31637.1 DNA polymerase III, chi subunit [Pacificibacter marinus]SLN22553.1 DNA polymerase III subunit chi [Pacificibacter marinus]